MDYNMLKSLDNNIYNTFKKTIEISINNNPKCIYKFNSCINTSNNIHYSIFFYNSKLSYGNMNKMEYYF